MMFGRRRKQAAAAAEANRRERQEIRDRAKAEHAACDETAHENYKRLPVAGSTKQCTKCGEPNLERALRRAFVGRHTDGCVIESNLAPVLDRYGLPMRDYSHRARECEVLDVRCRSCGADVDYERPLDAVRAHNAAARRNGMGVPVYEGEQP